MRFKKVYGFELMRVGETQNNLTLDEDVIGIYHSSCI